MNWKIWQNKIDKKQRIQEWIDWCEIPIIIEQPEWHDERIWRGNYSPSDKIIKINGRQSDQEIIKSIIHEICHWVNDDRVDDPDKWDREDRCIRVEKQWKIEPDNVCWR